MERFVYIDYETSDSRVNYGSVVSAALIVTDEKLKVKSIEDFDKNIISPISDYIKNNPDTVLLILPDHPTPCRLKTHTSDPVPFILYSPAIPPDSTQVYSESAAKKGELNFQYPWELLDHFFTQTGK